MELRLVADVPVGAFLSGGIDSSTIVAAMAERDGTPETFTVVFPREEERLYDERDDANVVVETFGTRHHELEARADARELLPEIVRHFDEPFGNPTALLVYELSRLTRQHVKVALAGDGADELFAGYPRFRGIAAASWYRRVPGPVRALAAAGARALPESTRGRHGLRRAREFALAPLGSLEQAYLSWITYFGPNQRAELLRPAVQERLRESRRPERFIEELFERAPRDDLVNRLSFVELQSFLPCNVLEYGDRMSMAHGLEVRAPYTDHKLVEHVFSLPGSAKLQRGRTKAILRTAAASRLPARPLGEAEDRLQSTDGHLAQPGAGAARRLAPVARAGRGAGPLRARCGGPPRRGAASRPSGRRAPRLVADRARAVAAGIRSGGMKQVLQDIRSGEIAVHEVPEPGPAPGYALVAVRHSLISAGTERAMAGLGAKSLRPEGEGPAGPRPQDRRDGAQRGARRDRWRRSAAGSTSTRSSATAARARCSTRAATRGSSVGQLVACVGQGYASHAEVVSVPTALVVPLPSSVSTADAAFAAPAAIAMHAIRLAGAEAGAVVAVVGLGLIGQLAGRLLRASGCTVVGTDPRDDRRTLFGDAADADGSGCARRSRQVAAAGADAVLVCAATAASGPVELAAALARDRAPIVVVGDVGLELDRAVFYEKELSLVVARSYGPGRYDRDYEERGLDYPAGYVRWTESRNIEAVLDLLASGSLRVDDLVTHRFAVGEGAGPTRRWTAIPTALGILLEYEPSADRQRTVRRAAASPVQGVLRVGLVGAGSFAKGTLLPALAAMDDVRIGAVCARSGASAKSVADRHDIPVASTDWRELVESDEIDALVVATPHAEHAQIAAAGAAGRQGGLRREAARDRPGRPRRGRGRGGRRRRAARRAQPPLRAARASAARRRGRAAPSADSRRSGAAGAGALAGGSGTRRPDPRRDLALRRSRDVPRRRAAGSRIGVDGRRLAPGDAPLCKRLGRRRSRTASANPGGWRRNGSRRSAPPAAATLDDFERLELFGGATGTTKSRRDKGHRAAVARVRRAALGRGSRAPDAGRGATAGRRGRRWPCSKRCATGSSWVGPRFERRRRLSELHLRVCRANPDRRHVLSRVPREPLRAQRGA